MLLVVGHCDDGLPTSGRVPLDPRLTQCVEEGKNFIEAYQDTPAQKAMTDIVSKLLTNT